MPDLNLILPDGRVVHSFKETVTEGKTKEIRRLSNGETELEGMVAVISKDDITAHNKAANTRQFPRKGEYSTQTNCSVMELWRAGGIPVAFVSRFTNCSNAFLSHNCKMILLEAVARRKATGSYLKRHPSVVKYHTFNPLEVEFFLKTTAGELRVDGNVLVSGLTTEEDDPLIENPYAQVWTLVHPQEAQGSPQARLGLGVEPARLGITSELMVQMDEILRRCFLILEEAWRMQNCDLIDMKIEFGITDQGELVVADVADNDSWRLINRETGQEMSKEYFRQGGDLASVAAFYAEVNNRAQHFPKMARASGGVISVADMRYQQEERQRA